MSFYGISHTTKLITWWARMEGRRLIIMSCKRKVSSCYPLTFWCKNPAGALASIPGNMLLLTLGFGPSGTASPSRKGKLFYWKWGSYIHGIDKGIRGVNHLLTCNLARCPPGQGKGSKEPGERLLAICSVLIPPNPLPETRQKANYMSVEEFIFPDGQPEAIVHWHTKSPNTEKSSPIMYLIKSTKFTSQTSYLETWKVLERVYKGEPLLHIEFHLLWFGQLVRKQSCENYFPIVPVIPAYIGLILPRQPLALLPR